MSKFVQLDASDCSYLIDLINDMDSGTSYTEKQRAYTVPKLVKIARDPRAGRLAYQDVEYLLELIEDDDVPEVEQQRFMTQEKLLAIQNLQLNHLQETKNIEVQRAERRARRNPAGALQEHFERASA